jgi:hypothetical protein
MRHGRADELHPFTDLATSEQALACATTTTKESKKAEDRVASPTEPKGGVDRSVDPSRDGSRTGREENA